MNPWLGGDRGFLTDWITQRWVRLTGRRIALAEAPWLRGPVAAPTVVAEDEFERYAARARSPRWPRATISRWRRSTRAAASTAARSACGATAAPRPRGCV